MTQDKAHRVVGTGAEAAAPVVGVVGGGQLARMLQEAAVPLGIQLHALVEAADGSAGQVIQHSTVGYADDEAAISELARGADVVTVEHEHVPNSIIEMVEGICPMYPNVGALQYAQDKLKMRAKMDELGLPNPRWFRVTSEAEVAEALAALGGEGVLKTPRDGYDGKGVKIISDAAEATEWLDAAMAEAAAGTGDGALLLEEKVAYDAEVAQLVARRPSGDSVCWPLVGSVQQDGVCFEVTAPAPGAPAELVAQASEVGQRIAEALGVVGVLAVEMFVAGGRLLINELAMRPHNSGHWTIEGAQASQFENHLRAVLDLPLGRPRHRAPWVVMVNVLGSALDDPRSAYPSVMEAFPNAHIHMYGKEVRPGRKLGHVTVLGDDLDAVKAEAHGAAAMLRGES